MRYIKKAQNGKVITEKSLRPDAIKSDYSTFIGKKSATDTSARAKAIRQGLFKEDPKTGDLYPTKKYYAAKKAQGGKNVPKGMVESEMFPGKMIPKTKSNYATGKIAKMAEAPKAAAKAAVKAKPKAEGGKWIQKAIKKPGALRSQLGAKPGKPIPAAKLAKAAKAKGKLGQRARLAMTLKKMRKK